MRDLQIFLKCPLENLKFFLFSFFFNIIILLLNILGWAATNIFKMPFEKFEIFSFFFFFNIIILLLNILGWARPNHLSRT